MKKTIFSEETKDSMIGTITLSVVNSLGLIFTIAGLKKSNKVMAALGAVTTLTSGVIVAAGYPDLVEDIISDMNDY